MEDGDKWERNQWYFTAKCFEQGVMRGGSTVARICAARLSSKTVEIVDRKLSEAKIKALIGFEK